MKIKSIKVNNCRGISSLVINQEIVSNKPNIFVAPNGFGKTSFAHAFSDIIGHTSLKLDDDDRHFNNENNEASIELDVELEEYVGLLKVNEHKNSNEIRKYFDICVVTNPQYVKATQRCSGGFIPPKGKMVIDPIEICPKVTKISIPISMATIKRAFGPNSILLMDLTNFMSNNTIANVCISLLNLLKNYCKERKYQLLEKIRSNINALDLSNTTESIKDIDDFLVSDKDFNRCFKVLKTSFNKSNLQNFCILWELVYLLKKEPDKTESFFVSERYRYYKSSLTSIVENLNTSKYKKACVNEKKGSLRIEIPDPKMISNGQRDILSLVGFLYGAQIQLQKRYSILIIDELFDYLDDANMTVAQYYISQLIEDFKATGRDLFPIILTHLNPNFFRNYVFKKQKVIYLNNSKFSITPALQKLIDIRDDPLIKNDVSKYLFHYHTDNFDFQKKLTGFKDVRSKWGKKGEFLSFLSIEFDKYKNNQQYDPLAVCAYMRVKIEENAYKMLLSKKQEFLDEHITGNKLKIAAETGIDIPEPYFLLRIIYDEAMHSRTEKNNTSAIEAKLENVIIKEMIIKCIEG